MERGRCCVWGQGGLGLRGLGWVRSGRIEVEGCGWALRADLWIWGVAGEVIQG